MTGSPLNSLYHSVHSVYAPALLKNEAGRQELSGKVQVSTPPNTETFFFILVLLVITQQPRGNDSLKIVFVMLILVKCGPGS